MEYFLVRYASRVVIYEHKTFIRLATSLAVMEGDSYSEGCGFESKYHLLDKHF